MDSKFLAKAIAAAAAMFSFMPLMAAVVVPAAYERSFTVTFPGYGGSETLTDFPVLVKISSALNGFDYSACKVEGGGDLRFADADGNLLASEVDTWNPGGESLVWVKVPLFNKDTVITAYYGNGNPDSVTASDVWSNGYVGVWHLNEPAVPLADSSGKATPFVLPASTKDRTTYATNGVAGSKSVSFDNELYSDANYNRLEANDAPNLRGLTNLTVECWTYQTRYRDDGDASIIGTWKNWKLYQEKATGILASRWMKANGDKVYSAKTPSGLPLNEWAHLTLVRNFTGVSSANGTLYLNGGFVATKSESGAEPTGDGSAVTYCLGSNDSIRVFPGSIDEVRVSNVARSADWIKASHDCVTEEGFASFGVMEGENDWTKYSHRFKVLFSGYAGNETLANFPVLVKISESGIPGFRYADCKKLGGGDLRFADASGNLLASEVDTWNPGGESLVWVKVPSFNKDTRITAYYGWKFAPVVDSSAVWTGNGYVGVWHLNEDAVPFKESSGGSSPFTASDKSEYANCGAVGRIGKSVDFDRDYTKSYGTPRLQSADNDGHLSGLTDFTVECWTYQTNYWSDGVGAGILTKGNGGDRSWRVYQDKSTANSYSQFELSDTNGHRMWATTSRAAPSGEWTHQTFVRNKTGLNQCLVYFNGENVGSKNDTRSSIMSNTKPLIVGGGGESNSRVFPGSIDEVRISTVARSADWVKASHDTVTGSSFAIYGTAKKNVDTGMVIILK